MRVALAFAAGAVLLASRSPSAAPLTPAEAAAVDVAATKGLADTRVPAASIAIVRDGAIVYAKAYGMQRAGQAPFGTGRRAGTAWRS